jgi:hypothetical protein
MCLQYILRSRRDDAHILGLTKLLPPDIGYAKIRQTPVLNFHKPLTNCWR